MKLDLSYIAAQLEGLEETIIAKLIDRAQFNVNSVIYRPGESGFEDEPRRSLFEIRLARQESMDADFGRFHVPEERPFNKGLPEAKRKVKRIPSGLGIRDFDAVNLTGEIKSSYLKLIAMLCRAGDDGHYGSSVEHDVYALQAISRRIHFGSLYVAECKYQADPEEYDRLLEREDVEGIMSRLTREEVELRIIARVRDKVATIQKRANPVIRHLINPEIVVDYYQRTIIPLTKKGEVRYLIERGKMANQQHSGKS